MMKRIGIIGAGRFGEALAESLTDRGIEVLMFDHNRDRVQAMSSIVTKTVQGDATNARAIDNAGFGECDIAVVAIGSNMEGSILATVNCKELGVPTVIAKAVSDMHGKVLERVGADIVVYPDRDRAIRLARSIVSRTPIDLFELADGYSVAEVSAPEKLVGQTLMSARVRQTYGVTVLAVRRKSDDIKRPRHTLIATGEETIKKEDLWLVFGPDTSLLAFGFED